MCTGPKCSAKDSSENSVSCDTPFRDQVEGSKQKLSSRRRRWRRLRQIQFFVAFHLFYEAIGIGAAEAPEDAGMDQEFAEGRGNEPTENHGRDRVQNLATRLLPAVDEWD